MDITSSEWQADYRHTLPTKRDPATYQLPSQPLPTTGLKTDRAQIDKQLPPPLVQRSIAFAHLADPLLGNCLANTGSTRAMSSTGLVMDHDSWLQYLQSSTIPVSPTTLAMVEVARERVMPFGQLIFVVEPSLGFGDLNLYIECIRCFKRLSPNTIQRIEFTGDSWMLETKLAPLISGFSQNDTDPAKPSGCGKIFGIDYIVTDKTTDVGADALYVYTVNDSENKLPPNCQSIQIVNYRWFRTYNFREDGIVLNQENHLPVYPCEITAGITSINELHTVMVQSFEELSANSKYHLYTSPPAVASLLGNILSQAAADKIHLAFCYHSDGMTYQQYRLYIQAALKCFGEKPIIFIVPNVCLPLQPTYLSAKGQKILATDVNVEFIDTTVLSAGTVINLQKNNQVTVINTDMLPKRVVELIGLFSTLPGFGPGASTANLFECLGIPYLGKHGHEITTAGDSATAQRWWFINCVFEFQMSALHEVIELFKESSDVDKRCILENWFDSKPGTITEPRNKDCIASTFLHHFFQCTDVAIEFIELTPAQRTDYIDRLLADDSLLKQYITYLHNESVTIIADYLLSATDPNGEFRKHAKILQAKALNPVNNTLLEAIKRQLSVKSALAAIQPFLPSILQTRFTWK